MHLIILEAIPTFSVYNWHMQTWLKLDPTQFICVDSLRNGKSIAQIVPILLQIAYWKIFPNNYKLFTIINTFTNQIAILFFA